MLFVNYVVKVYVITNYQLILLVIKEDFLKFPSVNVDLFLALDSLFFSLCIFTLHY